ncbi:MAG: hypothetical protein KF847_13590 [Pirellulales bacterium]|nr:hypothetical protein [Pirellulales bacterium]
MNDGSRRCFRRQGATLVATLACAAVAFALAANMLRAGLRSRHDVQDQSELRQAVLLAEAGLVRAVGALADDPDYAGETWRLDAESLAGIAAGEVVIAVDPFASAEPSRRIRVAATLAPDSPRSVRSSLTAIHPLNSSPSGERLP